jgi:hypothetical protein
MHPRIQRGLTCNPWSGLLPFSPLQAVATLPSSHRPVNVAWRVRPVDGPSHFARNTLRPLGKTALKRRLLVCRRQSLPGHTDPLALQQPVPPPVAQPLLHSPGPSGSVAEVWAALGHMLPDPARSTCTIEALCCTPPRESFMLLRTGSCAYWSGACAPQVALGWTPVPVPFFNFPHGRQLRLLYMHTALAHFAGLALPLPPRPPAWDAARHAAARLRVRAAVAAQPDCGLGAACAEPAHEGAALGPAASRSAPAAAAAAQPGCGCSAADAETARADAGPDAATAPAAAAADPAELASAADEPHAAGARHAAVAGAPAGGAASAAAAQQRVPAARKQGGRRGARQGGRFSLVAGAAAEAVRRRQAEERAAASSSALGGGDEDEELKS